MRGEIVAGVIDSRRGGPTGRLPSLSESSRQALVGLLIHGPASRADLARRLNLSGASLTRISRALEEDNLILDGTPNSEQRMGRPSQLVDVNVDRVHLLGVKLSSGSMNLARTDMQANILAERSVMLPSNDVETVTNALVSEIQAEIASDDRVAAVGLSLAGPVSPRSKIIRLSPFLQWHQVPLVREVEQRTGLLAVVENDVRALTAAEHWFGAAAGSTDFALVTIGIGTGCGLVVDDQLVDGIGGASGQIGHLPVTDNGPLCERGHRGCVRSYLSSGIMLRHAASGLARPDLTWDGLLELGSLGQSGGPQSARRGRDSAGHRDRNGRCADCSQQGVDIGGERRHGSLGPQRDPGSRRRHPTLDGSDCPDRGRSVRIYRMGARCGRDRVAAPAQGLGPQGRLTVSG